MPKTWIDKQYLVLSIWTGLENGQKPHELAGEDGPSQRTIERLGQAKTLLENGRPDGEVAKVGNWKLTQAQALRRFHETYSESLPEGRESTLPEKAPPSREELNELGNRLDRLVESMWIPNPDHLPLDPAEVASGFHAVDVKERTFCWTQVGRRVDRCWFTDAEEQWLLEIIELLPGDSHKRQRLEQYYALQAQAVDYIARCLKYQFGAYASGELVPIPRLRSAWLGGEVIDENKDQIGDSYRLMNDYPKLRGLVEEFRRNLLVDLGRLSTLATR